MRYKLLCEGRDYICAFDFRRAHILYDIVPCIQNAYLNGVVDCLKRLAIKRARDFEIIENEELGGFTVRIGTLMIDFRKEIFSKKQD